MCCARSARSAQSRPGSPRPRFGAARKSGFPMSCPSAGWRFPAIMVRILTSGSSGGMSLAGCARRVPHATLGFQITFFRARNEAATENPSAFTPRQILFAHAALADAAHGRLQHDQRAARAGLDARRSRESRARASGSTTGGWCRPSRATRRRLRRAHSNCALALRDRPSAVRTGRGGVQPQRTASARGELLLQSPSTRGRRDDRARRENDSVRGTRLARPRMVERLRAAGSRRLGLDRHQPGRWRYVDGVRHALEKAAACTLRAARAQGPTVRGVHSPRRRCGSSRCAAGARRAPASNIRSRCASLRAEEEWTLEPLMDDQELDSRLSTGTIYWEGAVRLHAGGREVGQGLLGAHRLLAADDDLDGVRPLWIT